MPRGLDILSVKLDYSLIDRLHLLEAWNDWKVPVDQQREWYLELFGPGGGLLE